MDHFSIFGLRLAGPKKTTLSGSVPVLSGKARDFSPVTPNGGAEACVKTI